jgi:hypothetical protein
MTKKKKIRIAKRLGWILAAIAQSEDIPMDVMDKIIEFTYDISYDVGGVPLTNTVRKNLSEIMEKIKKEVLKNEV